MLVQRAPARDVEHLGPAADRQHRHLPGHGAPGERELEAVELGLGRAELGVLVGTVGPGVQVRAARQAETVEPVEQAVDRAGSHGCEDHGKPAALAHGLQVALAERELGARRLALGQDRVIVALAHLGGGDADDRLGVHRRTQVSLAPPR